VRHEEKGEGLSESLLVSCVVTRRGKGWKEKKRTRAMKVAKGVRARGRQK
jgi:hypothetical protein